MVRKLMTLVAVLTLVLMPLNFAIGSGSVYAQEDTWDWESDTWSDTTSDYDYYYESDLSGEAAAGFLLAYGLFFGCFFIISIVYMGLTLITI